MRWLVNTSLLKVICTGICLCKLTYSVIYRLTLNKSDLRQRSKILNVNNNKDSHIWNDMIIVPSANPEQISATQTEFWCKLNYQFEPKTNKGECEAKRNWNKSHQLNIQTKNTYKRNNVNIACQLLHQSRW